jgi:outer membrane lipoprotein-sorting protein
MISLITYDSAISPDKDGHYLLVLTPRQKNTTFNVLRLTIDKNNFYILRLSFDDAFGNSTDLRFSRIQFNTGLPKTFFLYKPPKGVQVFEMP